MLPGATAGQKADAARRTAVPARLIDLLGSHQVLPGRSGSAGTSHCQTQDYTAQSRFGQRSHTPREPDEGGERLSQDEPTKAPAVVGTVAPDDTNPAAASGPTGSKLLIEFAPLILFFAVYARFDIYTATGVLMAATVGALIASRIMFGKLSLMPLVTGAFVLIFGSLTWWFSDETFIKIKPTIVYLCFAGPLLGGLLFRKSLLSHVLGEAIALDESGWRSLTLRWGLFFVGLAVINEVVWRHFSTSVWVSVKTFGFLPLTVLFAVCQAPLMMRHKAQPQVAKKEQG